MNLPVKFLTPTARLPTRGSTGAAGLDLYADLGGEGRKSTEQPFPTGIAVEIPPGYAGLIWDRSGMAKKGIFVVGGLIDSDFRGMVQVMLQCPGWPVEVEHGQRIAQLLIVPCPAFEPVRVDELGDTERGGGGFGSTGR